MTIEPSTSKPAMAAFWAGVVLTMVPITAAGNSSALTIDLNLGCSAMDWAICGLIFQQSFNRLSLNSR